jgi:hypothetical protein
MKKEFIPLLKHPGKVDVQGFEIQMTLPEGCTGILMVFGTKKAARNFFGKKKIEFVTVEEVKP